MICCVLEYECSATKWVRDDKQETAMFSLNVAHEYFIIAWHGIESWRKMVITKAVKQLHGNVS